MNWSLQTGDVRGKVSETGLKIREECTPLVKVQIHLGFTCTCFTLLLSV